MKNKTEKSQLSLVTGQLSMGDRSLASISCAAFLHASKAQHSVMSALIKIRAIYRMLHLQALHQ